jgi:hypothetical protein
VDFCLQSFDLLIDGRQTPHKLSADDILQHLAIERISHQFLQLGVLILELLLRSSGGCSWPFPARADGPG